MTQPFDVIVYVGRFQPFLNSDLANLRHALRLAPRGIVAIAGARQAKSPRHPFSADERIAQLRAALASHEATRVLAVPMRDDYDHPRRTSALRRSIATTVAATARVGIMFAADCPVVEIPEWQRVPPPALPEPDATATSIREALYAAKAPAAVLAQLDPLPPGIRQHLHDWTASPEFAALAREWRIIQEQRAEWANAPYPPVFVTTDAVVTCAHHVLLIRRGHAPGTGLHALPGGFLEPDETVLDSALRELAEETRIDVPESRLRAALKGVQVFDAPGRSQRGRVVTHAHHFALEGDAPPRVTPGDDAAAAFWVPVPGIAALEDQFHDDHFLILDHFLQIADTTIATPMSLV